MLDSSEPMELAATSTSSVPSSVGDSYSRPSPFAAATFKASARVSSRFSQSLSVVMALFPV